MAKKDMNLQIAATTRKKALKDIRKFAKARGWTAYKISLQKSKILYDKSILFETQFNVRLRSNVTTALGASKTKPKRFKTTRR